jgi:plasmid stabilization system protein ParE
MKDYQLVFHRMVQADVQDAYSWYESNRRGLGSEFVLAVEASLEAIKRNPLQFPSVERKIRRALVQRFPYLIGYQILKDRILVLAVMHSKRDPSLLKDRIGA